MSFLTVEFGNGQRSLEKKYPKIQDHVNTTLKHFLDTQSIQSASPYMMMLKSIMKLGRYTDYNQMSI